MEKPQQQHQQHHLLTNILLRLLSFLFLIFLARFAFLLSLSPPSLSSSVPITLPSSPLLLSRYATLFRSLIADGFLSLNSRSLCLHSLTGLDVAALKLIGVKRTARNGINRFKNHTFDFVFSSNLDRSSEPGKFAYEINRTLKPSGFFVAHMKGKDDYSLDSLLNLFPSFRFVRSRTINGLDCVREVILMKQKRKVKVVNKCSVKGYNRNLVKNMEPLVSNEKLKPWVSKNKWNLKNVTYLPSMVDISFKTRYVYIDVGARNYDSSIGNWFRKKYPKQEKKFQIFAIEANSVFHDEYRNKKRVTLVPYAAWTKNETLFFEIKRKQIRKNEEKGRGMGRAQSAQSSINFANDVNKIEGFDFVDWLKGLVLETDFVVVKMDVEGSEFYLIPKLVESGVICLVDELFIECHYNKKNAKYQKTYEECLEMFSSLRDRGIFVHQWW